LGGHICKGLGWNAYASPVGNTMAGKVFRGPPC
jgi:hypothetical protein